MWDAIQMSASVIRPLMQALRKMTRFPFNDRLQTAFIKPVSSVGVGITMSPTNPGKAILLHNVIQYLSSCCLHNTISIYFGFGFFYQIVAGLTDQVRIFRLNFKMGV